MSSWIPAIIQQYLPSTLNSKPPFFSGFASQKGTKGSGGREFPGTGVPLAWDCNPMPTVPCQEDTSNNSSGLLSQQIQTPDQIRELAIQLLAIQDPTIQLKNPSKLIYHELEFFASNDKTAGAPLAYFDQIARLTSSISGKLYLQHILLNHTDQLELLHQRQAIINRLSSISSISSIKRAFLLDAKAWFKTAESIIYWNIAPKTPEMCQVLDMLFFTKAWNRMLNTNETFLGVYFYLVMIITPIWGVISPFVFFFIPYLAARYIVKLPIPFDFYLEQMKGMLFGKQFFGMIKIAHKVFESIYKPAEGGIENIKTKIIDNVFAIITHDAGRYVYLAFVIASYLYGIYSHVTSSMNYNKLLNFIHQRMNYIRSLLDKSVACLDVLAEFRDHSQEFASITTACLDKLNNDPLLKAIRTHSIFIQEPSFLTNKGQIVKLYYLLEQAERTQIFAPFVKLMSWVDCWLGVTDLVAEQGFCEARWNITSETPCLDLVDCWSPVGGKVANSIKLMTPDFQQVPETLLANQTGSKSSLLDKEETKSSSDIITQNPEPLLDEQHDSKSIQEEKEDNKSGLLDKEEDKSSSDNPEPLLDEQHDSKSIQEEKEGAPASSNITINTRNTININHTLDRPNCLLTGPNGSGKSTFLKAIMSAVILGQTIGFTPAKEFRITPFRHLSTYLNIPDCQGRESLFQAEMRRCHDHLELLKSLEQSKGFSLNIMDEIFVSTNYMEGLSGAYGVIKSLEGYPHSLNIITTHFDKLTECQLPTFCYKYFTLDTKTMENGEIEIKKDYKLRDGINDKHMALHLLKLRGFDAELVKNAGEMYASIANPGS